MEKGALVNIQDSTLSTPLHIAISKNLTDIIYFLMQYKADISLQNDMKETTLCKACSEANIEILKLLLKKSNKEIMVPDVDGWLPIHVACRFRNLEVINLLMDNKASVNVTNNYGLTPLHLAVHFRAQDTVKYLLLNKADINAVDSDGLNIMNYSNSAAINEILLAYKASSSINLSNEITIALHPHKLQLECAIGLRPPCINCYKTKFKVYQCTTCKIAVCISCATSVEIIPRERIPCTTIAHGRSFITQAWWNCNTCSLNTENKGQGCCTACALQCHEGHNVIFKETTTEYCDCGSVHAESCKSLK